MFDKKSSSGCREEAIDEGRIKLSSVEAYTSMMKGFGFPEELPEIARLTLKSKLMEVEKVSIEEMD